MTITRTLLLALLGAALGPVSVAGAQDAPPAWDAPSLPLRHATPDLVLDGTVAIADNRTVVEVPFTVPKGTTRITVAFDHDGRAVRTTINLGLFDAAGQFRGWSGSNKNSFTVAPSDATLSYLPGAIMPGKWRLNLGVSSIRPDVRTHWTAKVWFWRAGDTPAVSTFSPEPLDHQARWYHGDLHMHTGSSDGFCASVRGRTVPCAPYRTVQAAEKNGLDFIAMSDHNSISHFGEMRALQAYHDDILLIPAVEITTAQGHANLFGTTEFVDYRLGAKTAPDMAAIVAAAARTGGILSINHPTAPTNEACRGCGWTAALPPGRVHVAEIVNGGEAWAKLGVATGAGERSGLSWWEERLNAGERIVGVGGSDNHDVDLGRLGVGFPTTAVHAPNLSERAILDNLAAGHVFIDLSASRDKLLDVSAEADGATAMMGDTLAAAAGRTVRFSAHVGNAAGASLRGWIDGQRLPLGDAEGALRGDDRRGFAWVSDGKRHWIRIDVWQGNRPVLIGNPVYLNREAGQ